jgi:hypothetical protein
VILVCVFRVGEVEEWVGRKNMEEEKNAVETEKKRISWPGLNSHSKQNSQI